MEKKYYEIVISGPHEYVRGFVTGILVGRHLVGEAFWGEEFNLEKENPLSMLGRLLSHRKEQTVVIVDARSLGVLEEAIRKWPEHLDLEIISRLPISEGSFRFSVETFSREVAQELKSIFSSLPPGVKMEPPYQPREVEMPEGKGTEVYAPLHDYVFRIAGTLMGRIPAILALYAKLKRYEVVELSTIEFK